MPHYDYRCEACGPFSAVRPMARAAEPAPCPGCGAGAARAFFSVPGFALMNAASRTAHATNERARNEPRRASQSGHGAGCACCGGGGRSKAVLRPDGSKTFPSARPWQISH